MMACCSHFVLHGTTVRYSESVEAMHIRALVAALFVLVALPKAAFAGAGAASDTSDPGPPSPCISAVFRQMLGSWSVDDEKFRPDDIPANAWNVRTWPGYANQVVVEKGYDTSIWYLTEFGADYVEGRRGKVRAVYSGTRLISCQPPSAEAPGVVYFEVFVSGLSRRMRQRFEVDESRLKLQRFDPNDVLVSEEKLRRHNPVPMPVR